MYPPAFDYVRATSVDEALSQLGEGGKLLAGGHSLLPVMKLRLADPGRLIDIGRIEGLRGIDRSGDSFTIGALTTHAMVAAAADDGFPAALAEAAGMIGDPQVRNRGTVGGNVAHADPASDLPTVLLALGATFHATGPGGSRSVAAGDFFTGLFETALEEDEIVTAVRFPPPRRAAYMKFPNPASRYAIVGVMVSKGKDGVRVAVTGAGPSVFRLEAMEQALSKEFAPQAIEKIEVPEDGLNADIHASAEYRAHLVTVMARRAVAAANG